MIVVRRYSNHRDSKRKPRRYGRPPLAAALFWGCLGLFCSTTSSGVTAWVVPCSTCTPAQSSTALSAVLQQQQAPPRRRLILQGLRRLLFGGAAAVGSSRSHTRPQQQDVLFEATGIPTTGRMVAFRVHSPLHRSRGTVKIQLRPEWAPRGVARFEELTETKFWDQCRIFRVLPGVFAQFGIAADPDVQAHWRSRTIPDDPLPSTSSSSSSIHQAPKTRHRISNQRGTVSFATGGSPHTRTSQVFINTRHEGNAFLDDQGFCPIGHVVEGMELVDSFFAGYGDGAPAGAGPHPGLAQRQGNDYLKREFPNLSYISTATFVA